ncbi:hypothetical protein ACFV2H_35735 [Streptomyces sp. NPDC059629]|uniref:hypothetical protein n=1 Tax=Streptomyces sp. NPDC059629 TaxID=3346889 RepID=UPI0036C61C54
MSTEHTTRVESTQGVTHTGDGHIYVNLGAAAHEPRKPTFRQLPDDQLRWTRRVLVAPVNMGKARTTLEETGTVILDGAPGSGRSATARVLLREHHRPGGAFRELLPDELPLHDPAFVDPGDRLLLDLSTAEAGLWHAARGGLPALRQTVRERRAHLVVAHALQALCDLVADSRRLRRKLLDRLARGDLAPTDLAIFMRVSDPEPLTDRSVTTRALVDEDGVQRSLITCWRAVLTYAVSRPEGRRVAPRTEMQSWLHWAAEGAGDRGEVLLDLLVAAADRCGEDRGAAFAALYASARQAECASPGAGAHSAETTDLLLHKIGVAQNLGPAAPSASARGGRS